MTKLSRRGDGIGLTTWAVGGKMTTLSCGERLSASVHDHRASGLSYDGGDDLLDTSDSGIPVAEREATPMSGSRVLLIDDEERILNFVARGLRSEGLVVDVAPDGDEGLRRALAAQYDLVILDLLMPGFDGMSVLRGILERKPDQSVMVLSALADTTSKVRSLELGAEDYLAKPFSLDELLARVRARLRTRVRSNQTRLAARHLSLDVIRREADAGLGPVPLAEREFLVLQELMMCAGRIVSKEHLLSKVWGYYFEPGSNVVDVYVRRLRAKLGPDAILTVRGEGYRIDAA
jgi:two-component system copper resistance phosphate regulon response regulator CusR